VRLAVVAYPNLQSADRNWIESVRMQHDPQATRLRVHFTLVFPFDGQPAAVIEEIAAVARTTSQIAFEISSARVVSDVLTSQIHVFLVPSQGAAEILTLHERLYSNSLRAHERHDIPYIPHLTVAAHSTVQSAECAAQKLRLGGPNRRVVRGMVPGIELVDLAAQAATDRSRKSPPPGLSLPPTAPLQ
jgi:2'-5' RNA ligase